MLLVFLEGSAHESVGDRPYKGPAKDGPGGGWGAKPDGFVLYAMTHPRLH